MNDEELPRYSATSGKVVRSQNTGRWTDELTGEKYVFSCSLREEPDFSYGNTARSIFVQLLRETASQQQQREEIGYLKGILLLASTLKRFFRGRRCDFRRAEENQCVFLRIGRKGHAGQAPEIEGSESNGCVWRRILSCL